MFQRYYVLPSNTCMDANAFAEISQVLSLFWYQDLKVHVINFFFFKFSFIG